MNHLSEIITELQKQSVNFVICGGVASVLHGVDRVTTDIDIAVDWDRESTQNLLRAMANLKLVPRVPLPPETLLDKAKIDQIIREKNALVFTFIDLANPYRQVDIFLTDQMSYTSLVGSSELMKFRDGEIRVLTKEKMIELKQQIRPSRDKDRYDIEQLRKIIRGDQKHD
jgi:hypothetical protein